MLAGFVALAVVSKLTPSEPAEAIASFFKKMNTHSDQIPGQPEKIDKELLLLDVSTWFSRSRWSQFANDIKQTFLVFYWHGCLWL